MAEFSFVPSELKRELMRIRSKLISQISQKPKSSGDYSPWSDKYPDAIVTEKAEVGYLRFAPHTKAVQIGRIGTRKYRLLKTLFDPNLPRSKPPKEYFKGSSLRKMFSIET